jgi:hypothetical protein
MIHRATIVVSSLLLFALSLVAPGQSAVAGWAANHPRRAEVNLRLTAQNHRINRELREGELTAGQARHLHHENQFIGKQERFMASQNHGHITPAGQRTLNQEENGVSKQIGQ